MIFVYRKRVDFVQECQPIFKLYINMAMDLKLDPCLSTIQLDFEKSATRKSNWHWIASEKREVDIISRCLKINI